MLTWAVRFFSDAGSGGLDLLSIIVAAATIRAF